MGVFVTVTLLVGVGVGVGVASFCGRKGTSVLISRSNLAKKPRLKKARGRGVGREGVRGVGREGVERCEEPAERRESKRCERGWEKRCGEMGCERGVVREVAVRGVCEDCERGCEGNLRRELRRKKIVKVVSEKRNWITQNNIREVSMRRER